jgi:hypothetical protein
MTEHRITLDQLGPKHRAEALAQLRDPYETPPHPASAAAPDPGVTIRQKRGRSSKLEEDFKAFLLLGPIPDQSHVLGSVINLELANGCRYRPDAWVVYGKPLQLLAYEVKGRHAWDDSVVKLKVAARAYPWIRFHLVTRPERLGPWKIALVEP